MGKGNPTKNNGWFSGTQQVATTRRTLLRFWGGSKVNYNIAIVASDVGRKSGMERNSH